jgi:hypothetical protein
MMLGQSVDAHDLQCRQQRVERHCLARMLGFLSPFQDSMYFRRQNPGAAALRACPWLPSTAPSVLIIPKAHLAS